MYSVVLAIHNILRWIALILVLFAFVRAIIGVVNKQDWQETDRKAGLFASISLDIQLLIGLLLYFVLSPITRGALQNFGAAMGNSGLRFFALEHALYMLLAVVFVHLGSVLPRRTGDSSAKFRRAAIWFGLTILVILLGMPWARPLLPGFG